MKKDIKEVFTKKFDAEKVVIDWTMKCEGGYAKYPFTDSDVSSLREVLHSYGILDIDAIVARIRNKINFKTYQTEFGNDGGYVLDITGNYEQSDIHYAFNAVKDDYAKYLSIMYYFDSNSLGTISEVLLTELIKKVPDVTISHTGKNQGLADLVINGQSLSLKTTQSGKTINLGSHDLLFSMRDNNLIMEELLSVVGDNFLEKIPIAEIKRSDKFSDKCKDSILCRLRAIKEKLVGDGEFFVWIEKIYEKSKIISKINIHILKVDDAKVDQIFDNASVYATPRGWGLYYNDILIISSDTAGKILNVHPNFIKCSLKDEEIIGIDIPIALDGDLEEVRDGVVTLFMEALDGISEKIYKK